jgi:hypothetical protein
VCTVRHRGKYVVDHLPEAIRDQVSLKLYRGGRMLCTKRSSGIAFSEDAKAFYANDASPVTQSD